MRDSTLSAQVKRTISVITLTLFYSLALTISKIGRRFPRKLTTQPRRIVINGTFHNPNWFFAHIEPIIRSGYGEVVLVCDEPIADLPGLRYACPPPWVARIFSRAGAKFLWTFGLGFRDRACLFMGYHVFPSAITALICARLLGAKAAYQITSGSLELEGGGWNAENRLLVALGKQTPWIERLALAVTRSFDLVVVRGSTAAHFVRERAAYRHHLEIITGSVDTRSELMQTSRDIDVIFVGRLTDTKRPDRLLDALAIAIHTTPSLRAVIVGDGPAYANLTSQTRTLGLQDHVVFLGQRSDVPELMGRARVFVLTSRWEGVSIAMLEAMALEVVPVVSDVGDLRDFVENDTTGYILPENDIVGFGEKISKLLGNEPLRLRLAQEARKRVIAASDKKILARRWEQVLSATVTGKQAIGEKYDCYEKKQHPRSFR